MEVFHFSKRKMMMLFAGLFMVMSLMTACGKEEKEVTSLFIDKNGKISNVIYEEFTQGNYSLDELTDMAGKEASSYNSEYLSQKVFLDETSLLEDGFVKVKMSYDSAYDYSRFNHVTLFYGTVSEAIDKGYTISDQLVDAAGEKLSPENKASSMDKHIIITDEVININVPYDIKYMSQGVTLIGKKEALPPESFEGNVQLLLSK